MDHSRRHLELKGRFDSCSCPSSELRQPFSYSWLGFKGTGTGTGAGNLWSLRRFHGGNFHHFFSDRFDVRRGAHGNARFSMFND